MIESYDELVQAMRGLGTDLMAWRSDAGARTVLSQRDFKLEADKRAHQRLAEVISRNWPDTPIISEEDATHVEKRPPRYWLIDPIDGTASWYGGFPGFVTQAALIENSVPVAGFVFQPAADRFFAAIKGRGASLNGARLAPLSPRDGLIMTDNTPEPHGIVAPLMSALQATGYVESGSLGLKCCLVAAGDADLFVKAVVVRDWDLAPAAAIFTEIAATLVLPDGSTYRFDGAWEKPDGFIAARNSQIANRAVTALHDIVSKGVNA